MEILGKDYELTATEKKLYLLGLIIFVFIFLLTIFWNSLFTPLALLQIRLAIVGIGLIYNFSIYYYYQHFLTKKYENIESIQQNDIIILFNGKELGRK